MPDPVTAVATAVSSVADLIRPMVEEHLAQKYDNEHRERVIEWQNALADANFVTRADRMWELLHRMLLDAGYPPAPTWGTGANVSVPAALLHALALATMAKVRDDKYIARMIQKQRD